MLARHIAILTRDRDLCVSGCRAASAAHFFSELDRSQEQHCRGFWPGSEAVIDKHGSPDQCPTPAAQLHTMLASIRRSHGHGKVIRSVK